MADDKGNLREEEHTPASLPSSSSSNKISRCLLADNADGRATVGQLLDVVSRVFKALAPAYPSAEIKELIVRALRETDVARVLPE